MQDRFNFRQSLAIGLLGMVPLLSSPLLLAQELAQWRGGWIADVAGVRHVLYLVLRDGRISGFHCADCYDPDHLAFVDDGTLDAKGLHFSLYHSVGGKQASVEKVDATLANGELQLTSKKSDAKPEQVVMKRSPPSTPAPTNRQPNQPAGGGPRSLPAAAITVTADKVLGLWLWGIGPGKQYFIFKRHKDGLRGMVCGPCENPKDFAPLENISMDGTNFHFDIVHEDNGGGYEEHGPFNNITDAVIAMNEMHITTVPSFDLQARKIEMSLLGPTRYMPGRKP
jgi:hypothetical protein